jgi:colanic acid/amylovoran biosynthesis glycosyltransferase
MVTYAFTGELRPEQVRSLYETQPFDAFINTSKSEGIPVTIMEALYAGIPVIAPAIGGIPELVDSEVGCLYGPDGGVSAVIAALRAVYDQTAEKAERMRAAARARWKERCAIDALLPQLFPDETEETAPT